MSSNISKGTKALVKGWFVPPDDIGVSHRVAVSSGLTSNSLIMQEGPNHREPARDLGAQSLRKLPNSGYVAATLGRFSTLPHQRRRFGVSASSFSPSGVPAKYWYIGIRDKSARLKRSPAR